MWLITHATGTIGQAVSRAASARGHALRLHVPDAGHTTPVVAGDELVSPDLANRAALESMFEGVDRLLLCAELGPELPDWHGALAEVAQARGVRHVVQITAQGADVDSPMRIFRWFGDAEARARATGLQPCVIRPALYMQILLKDTRAICGCGTIEAPFRAARWPLVDARDVAEAAVKLLEEGARPAVHELTGPQTLDYFEIARVISRVLGRRVEYRDVCAPKARGRLEARRLQPRLIDALLEFWDYAAAGAIAPRVTGELEALLGRPPRRLADFVKDEMQELPGAKASDVTARA